MEHIRQIRVTLDLDTNKRSQSENIYPCEDESLEDFKTRVIDRMDELFNL